MENQEQTQARLKGILDRIGPGISLMVDDRFMAAAFGEKTIVTEAKQFADANHCTFRYEPGNHHGDGTGYFGRAYSKKIDDA